MCANPSTHSGLQVHDLVRSEIPADEPIFWLGISMGGGVCVRAAQMREPAAASGLVLLAPMLSLTAVREEYLLRSLGIRNRHLYPIMNQLSYFLPTVKLVKKAENTVHPHIEREIAADPLNNTQPICVRPATEFVLITEAFMAQGGEKSLEAVRCRDLLLVHALADTFVEPGGSLAAYSRCSVSRSKTLLLIGAGDARTEGSLQQEGGGDARVTASLEKMKNVGMWHALTQEPGNTELADAIAEWICERASA